MNVVVLLMCVVLQVFSQEPTVYKRHAPCLRPCVAGQRRVCTYNFNLEHYITMSKACFNCPFNATDCHRPGCLAADGTERAVKTTNRQISGPDIQVCQGDVVIVYVINGIRGEETTIHWHGVHMKGTQYMDGVPMVTQCPIMYGNSFEYRFVAEPAGTHYWHSHSSHQRADGIFGALIVREPMEADVHSYLYDYDLPQHVVTVMDWTDRDTVAHFVAHHHSDGDNKPESMLVNGKGWYREFQGEDQVYKTPLEEFSVIKGKSYRFRIISNGVLNCPIEISIDNHNLTVITTDGKPVEPVEVESLIIYAGERFDVVLTANQAVDVYWIRFLGYIDCAVNNVSQVAILRYAGATDAIPSANTSYESMHRHGLQLNPVNIGPEDPGSLAITQLKSLLPDDLTSRNEPDYKFYLSYDFNEIGNTHFHDNIFYPVFTAKKGDKLYTPQINKISHMPPRAPLTSQFDDNPSTIFCNDTSVFRCQRHYCECVHMLAVPLGSLVEIILIDEGFTFDANHPFHLHGYSFRVVALEKIGTNVTLEQVKELDRSGRIKRNLHKAVAKDTVTVHDGGFTILRFIASNPGFWFFHCHLEWHAEIGMGLIIKVGDSHDLPPVPEHFPKCGDWPPIQKKPKKFVVEAMSSSKSSRISEFSFL